MDKRLAQAWHDDLLSGKFKQCAGTLHRTEAFGRKRNEREGHCCLGVLSERIAKHKVVRQTGWSWDGTDWTDGSLSYPGSIPLAVRIAVGLPSAHSDRFVSANDTERKTFKQIAAMIRKTYDLPEPSHG